MSLQAMTFKCEVCSSTHATVHSTVGGLLWVFDEGKGELFFICISHLSPESTNAAA